MNDESELQTVRTIRHGLTLNTTSSDSGIHRVPRLLVSVRSAREAERAIAGGVEILDVKEPSHGSLGMASLNEITAIASMPPVVSKEIPLSVALGEVIDWSNSSAFPVLPSGISFAKLGLSRCTSQSGWQSEWRRVRGAFDRRSKSILHWVAVAYADSATAESPGVHEVLDAAIDGGCAGLLIDTWGKGARNLFFSMDVTSIAEIADKCHAAGLFLAVAGKLDQASLPSLSAVPADILAIRSAACTASNRTSELDSGLVRKFRDEMRLHFSVCDP